MVSLHQGKKIGDALSILMTHSPRDYLKAFTNSADVVIFGRVSTPQTYALLRALQRRNTKVIYDLDDALFLLPRRLLRINL